MIFCIALYIKNCILNHWIMHKKFCFDFPSTNLSSSVIGTSRSEGSQALSSTLLLRVLMSLPFNQLPYLWESCYSQSRRTKKSETEIENVNVMFDSGFFSSVKRSGLEIITESLRTEMAHSKHVLPNLKIHMYICAFLSPNQGVSS